MSESKYTQAFRVWAYSSPGEWLALAEFNSYLNAKEFVETLETIYPQVKIELACSIPSNRETLGSEGGRVKHFVLMNKETGEIGIGVRATLTDGAEHEQEICALAGYSLQLRTHDFDGWLVAAEMDQPYVYASKEMVERKLEIIGEL